MSIILVIITYQVITGNYSENTTHWHTALIITYQVITGNYSVHEARPGNHGIITYQVITGNYSDTWMPACSLPL